MSYEQVYTLPPRLKNDKNGRDLFNLYHMVSAVENPDFERTMKDIQSKLKNLDLHMGPIKEEESAFKKLIEKKEGEIYSINDIIRCSFFSSSLIHEYKVINFLNANESQLDWKIHEIRDSHFPIYINGFSPNFKYQEKLFPRLHRDLRVILKKQVYQINVFAEIQMHLDGYEEINAKTHDLYDLERKLLDKQSTYFSDEDLYAFFEARLKIIELNEEAVNVYNENALKQKEKIYLMPGRQVIENVATKEGLDYEEKVFQLMTKGLAKNPKDTKRLFSEAKLRKDHGDWLVTEMNRVLGHNPQIIQFLQDKNIKVA
ncbi:MAG: hypothetical protein JW812_00455 [Alphaproteobacteria bacterium]|nr:hypothetical protein [Alphaproteobacteria bacterium]MBN2780103.1 hypothetical protein [Alphaproteobacteria bacterium]